VVPHAPTMRPRDREMRGRESEIRFGNRRVAKGTRRGRSRTNYTEYENKCVPLGACISMTKTGPLVLSMFLTGITVVCARRKTLVPSRY